MEAHLPVLQIVVPLVAAPLCVLLRSRRIVLGFGLVVTWAVLGIAIAVIIMIVLLCLGVLTNPGLFMPEDKQYRAITVHTEIPIGQEIDSIMAEVFERLDAVPIFDPDRKMNLILCSTQDKFTFFSRFTLRDKRVMGYCLLGNAYVNLETVADGHAVFSRLVGTVGMSI